MREFETIIVGAGPAGLIAGKYLKNAVILEQKEKIGRPVQCVGMSVQSLKQQGIEPDPAWAKSAIYKVERIMPNNKIIGKMKERPIGYVVEKAGFEKFLAKEIKAQLILKTEVVDIKKEKENWQVITSRGEVFQSKYVIAADGFSSIVRKKVFPEAEQFINTEFAIEYSIKLAEPINTKIVSIYFDNQAIKNGYIWIFPTSQNTADIGAGGGLKNTIASLEKILQEKALSQFKNCEIIAKAIGKTAHRTQPFSCFKDNVFLVGDCAGFNDPIFKAGTNQAMTSAKIASQCILENKAKQYAKIIENLPFAKKEIFQAAQKFYSFDNQILNGLGNTLSNRGFSDIKNPFVFAKLLTKKSL